MATAFGLGVQDAATAFHHYAGGAGQGQMDDALGSLLRYQAAREQTNSNYWMNMHEQNNRIAVQQMKGDSDLATRVLENQGNLQKQDLTNQGELSKAVVTGTLESRRSELGKMYDQLREKMIQDNENLRNAATNKQKGISDAIHSGNEAYNAAVTGQKIDDTSTLQAVRAAAQADAMGNPKLAAYYRNIVAQAGPTPRAQQEQLTQNLAIQSHKLAVWKQQFEQGRDSAASQGLAINPDGTLTGHPSLEGQKFAQTVSQDQFNRGFKINEQQGIDSTMTGQPVLDADKNPVPTFQAKRQMDNDQLANQRYQHQVDQDNAKLLLQAGQTSMAAAKAGELIRTNQLKQIGDPIAVKQVADAYYMSSPANAKIAMNQDYARLRKIDEVVGDPSLKDAQKQSMLDSLNGSLGPWGRSQLRTTSAMSALESYANSKVMEHTGYQQVTNPEAMRAQIRDVVNPPEASPETPWYQRGMNAIHGLVSGAVDLVNVPATRGFTALEQSLDPQQVNMAAFLKIRHDLHNTAGITDPEDLSQKTNDTFDKMSYADKLALANSGTGIKGLEGFLPGSWGDQARQESMQGKGYDTNPTAAYTSNQSDAMAAAIPHIASAALVPWASGKILSPLVNTRVGQWAVSKAAQMTPTIVKNVANMFTGDLTKIGLDRGEAVLKPVVKEAVDASDPTNPLWSRSAPIPPKFVGDQLDLSHPVPGSQFPEVNPGAWVSPKSPSQFPVDYSNELTSGLTRGGPVNLKDPLVLPFRSRPMEGPQFDPAKIQDFNKSLYLNPEAPPDPRLSGDLPVAKPWGTPTVNPMEAPNQGGFDYSQIPSGFPRIEPEPIPQMQPGQGATAQIPSPIPSGPGQVPPRPGIMPPQMQNRIPFSPPAPPPQGALPPGSAIPMPGNVTTFEPQAPSTEGAYNTTPPAVAPQPMTPPQLALPPAGYTTPAPIPMPGQTPNPWEPQAPSTEGAYNTTPPAPDPYIHGVTIPTQQQMPSPPAQDPVHDLITRALQGDSIHPDNVGSVIEAIRANPSIISDSPRVKALEQMNPNGATDPAGAQNQAIADVTNTIISNTDTKVTPIDSMVDALDGVGSYKTERATPVDIDLQAHAGPLPRTAGQKRDYYWTVDQLQRAKDMGMKIDPDTRRLVAFHEQTGLDVKGAKQSTYTPNTFEKEFPAPKTLPTVDPVSGKSSWSPHIIRTGENKGYTYNQADDTMRDPWGNKASMMDILYGDKGSLGK